MAATSRIVLGPQLVDQPQWGPNAILFIASRGTRTRRHIALRTAALEMAGTATLPSTLRAHADLEHHHVFGKLVRVIKRADAVRTPNG